MKIGIGSDRRGFQAKSELIPFLKKQGYAVIDCGPEDDTHPVDYPIYAEKVAKMINNNNVDFGILICSTGIGIMIAANKIHGIRSGIAYTDEVAKLMRQHNDANIVCFGQDQMNIEDIKRRCLIFLSTDFDEGYHLSRIKQISDLEQGIEIKQTPMLKKF